MKPAHVIATVIGILMIVLGFTADSIGLGPNPGMGWKQVSLMVLGALVVVVSLLLGKARD